jgi:hypothetical protein
MHRIQIDLDSSQFARLKAAARASSTTVSEVIRDAIEEKLARVKDPVDFEIALAGAAGIWARRTDLDSVGKFRARAAPRPAWIISTRAAADSKAEPLTLRLDARARSSG